MQKKSKVIDFPVASSFDANNHSLSQGGMTMKIKHTHPEYADEAERLERLQELKKVCLSKLAVAKKDAKRTA